MSESESQMDLSGFFAFGAGVFLGLGAASEGFLAATHQIEKDKSTLTIICSSCLINVIRLNELHLHSLSNLFHSLVTSLQTPV